MTNFDVSRIARSEATKKSSFSAYGLLRFARNDEKLLPRVHRLLDPARQHRPISAGPKALQQVHEAGIVADQDARRVLLDALDNAQRGGGGRGPGDFVETLDRLRAAGIWGHH